jgi:anti-sigma factor RsiW
MMCQEYDQLGDYVDGALDAAGRASLEAHLATCEGCQALVADFQAIRRAARDLEPLVPPSSAWTAIAAGFERQSRPWWRLGGSGTGFRSVWQPAAAVAMALALTASLTWLGGRLAPLAAAPPTVARTSTAVPALANVDLDGAAVDYTLAIAGLEQITEDERDALDPDTADVLQVNLTANDTAIGESRAALQTQPENDLAIASLFEALRRKLALLQDAVTLINEMRRGNPEGAARIVSGLNQ